MQYELGPWAWEGYEVGLEEVAGCGIFGRWAWSGYRRDRLAGCSTIIRVSMAMLLCLAQAPAISKFRRFHVSELRSI